MSAPIPIESRVRLYRMMQLIRRSQEQLIAKYHPEDEMRCPVHFCVGQESVPAAMSLLVRETDVLMSHYRSHGYFLAKGGALNAMVAELYGKATGANAGHAGSMELAAHDRNFFSGAIVGGTLVVPLGTAFAQKHRGTDAISISVFGDGSFDSGVTYESMNLAALYQLPLLLVCENNRYAANTAIDDRIAQTDFSKKVEAMGIPATRVDGYDLPALMATLAGAIAAVRSGKGPRYVEVDTYRYCAHVGPTSDDHIQYRPAEELEAWKKRDPIAALRKELAAAAPKDVDLGAIDAAIEAQIDAAIKAAKSAPFPKLEQSMKANWCGTYAPIAEEYFRDIKSEFKGDQKETRLAPF